MHFLLFPFWADHGSWYARHLRWNVEETKSLNARRNKKPI